MLCVGIPCAMNVLVSKRCVWLRPGNAYRTPVMNRMAAGCIFEYGRTLSKTRPFPSPALPTFCAQPGDCHHAIGQHQLSTAASESDSEASCPQSATMRSCLDIKRQSGPDDLKVRVMFSCAALISTTQNRLAAPSALPASPGWRTVIARIRDTQLFMSVRYEPIANSISADFGNSPLQLR